MINAQHSYPATPILLVDDEESFLRIARLTLAAAGITNVETLSDSRTVIARVSEHPFSVIALDINMPHVQGPDLLHQITRDFPAITVIMITGMTTTATVMRTMTGMRRGLVRIRRMTIRGRLCWRCRRRSWRCRRSW